MRVAQTSFFDLRFDRKTTVYAPMPNLPACKILSQSMKVTNGELKKLGTLNI